MKHREVMVKFMEALEAGDVPDKKLITHTWLSKHGLDDLVAGKDLGLKEYSIIECKEISNVMVVYHLTLRIRAGAVRIMLVLVREMGVRRTSMIPGVGWWGVNPDSWKAYLK